MHETRLSNGTTVTVVDVSKDVERWLIATVVIHVLVTVFAIITIIITVINRKGISVILRYFVATASMIAEKRRFVFDFIITASAILYF